MKTITIGGRLTKDAVLRRTGNSDAVLGFPVAVDHRDGQTKTTMYFDCSLWGKRGEALERYLTKGTSVAVSGDFGTREHDGKTYFTVRADQVTLMGGGQSEERQPERSSRAPAQRNAMDDEIFRAAGAVMTQIDDLSGSEHSKALARMELALAEIVAQEADAYGWSGLSSSALALQALMCGLKQLGGPSSKSYIQCMLDGVFCADNRDGARINKRGRAAMEKMASHFDAQRDAFKNRVMQ